MIRVEAPFWCPWCEEVIEDESGYEHAYDHRNKGPYAVDVEELISEFNTAEVFRELDDETLDSLNVCRHCHRAYDECECEQTERVGE